MKTKTLIVSLAADEQRAIRDLAFTAKCKNTGVVFTYEFGGRPRFEHFRRITEVFVWAMYKRRHSCGHESRLSQRDYYWKFLCFLDEAGITEPEKLNNKVYLETCDFKWKELCKPYLHFDDRLSPFDWLKNSFKTKPYYYIKTATEIQLNNAYYGWDFYYQIN